MKKHNAINYNAARETEGSHILCVGKQYGKTLGIYFDKIMNGHRLVFILGFYAVKIWWFEVAWKIRGDIVLKGGWIYQHDSLGFKVSCGISWYPWPYPQ